MVQKQIKNYLKLGILLFGVLLFLIACQKDDDLSQTPKTGITNSNLKVSTLRKTEIQKNKYLVNKIGKLKADLKAKNNSNNSSRDFYSSEYDFIVNTDYCKDIFDGLKHTYTFPVYRTQDNGLLKTYFW